MSPPVIRHELIIRHPSAELILLVRADDGYALPSVITEDRHTAEVEHINAAVRAAFGITTVFLRSLFHEPAADANPIRRCHEVAARGTDVSGTAQWCDPRMLPAGSKPGAPPAAKDGRGWELARWWDEAEAWVRAVVSQQRATVTDIIQLRAWPSSAVLRVQATDGDYYFKAVAHSIRRECAVTAYLAEHFPDCVPPLIAVDIQRRWLLMRAAGGRKLEEIDSAAPWEDAARRYGELQMATRAHAAALRGCGASERGLEQLARRLKQLADAEPELRRVLPALESRCAALAAYDIPPLLEHGDLWPGNFLVDDARSVLIDWEDVAVGHPFFSVAPLLVGLQTYQPALATSDTTERILAAYLDAFSPLDTPSRLRAALDLAIPLAFCDMALRYQQQRPSVVRLHPWMRDLVPEALRRAIAASSPNGRGVR